jgi:LPXTG-site transpeptidase (sortase) family protein
VTANGKLSLKHHLQSLSFGLAIGFISLVIALFGLFNEVVIAPFIQPGRTASATPIIVDPSNVATTTDPEIIIPKINLEIPVDYTQTSNDEETIQNALEHGIVHYPSTVMPGENGNAAFFGHSSNNILNPGKYKFAFVLLHELQPGDTFYLTKDGKVYIYKVFDRKVVDPDQTEVLDNVPGHVATATLITCDPPGTTLHRLVVIGDQISPDPATNGAGTNTAATDSTVQQLPDNGPSLIQRIWDSIF